MQIAPFQYEPDASASEKQLRTLFKAMQILSNFTFTAEEALREEIKKEAEAAADRENALQEQLAAAKEELDDLRDRLTVGAEGGGARGGESETFRAQIAALKEENYMLQQTARDRDRELADQRDRFESILARAESLHRERDNLMYNTAQMEETIAEMKRRLAAKNEGGEHEWESKKLRQRNEQAVQLSNQLQAVIGQNESLRDEVNRVSLALEDATRLMETTTQRYDDLSSRLLAATKRIGELEEEKEAALGVVQEMREAEEARIAAGGEAAMRTTFERTIDELRSDLAVRDHDVAELRAALATATNRLEWAEAKAELGTEKEEHLDQLRVQLQRATAEAKSLLGHSSLHRDDENEGGREGGEDTVSRRALLHAQHELQIARAQLEDRTADVTRLEAEGEEKDRVASEVQAELVQLRQMKLGDAAATVAELKRQLSFRDAQISKLNQQCSLLHIELGRYAQLEQDGQLHTTTGTSQPPASSNDVEDPTPSTTTSRRRDRTRDRVTGKHDDDVVDEPTPEGDGRKRARKIIPRPTKPGLPVDTTTVEEQAMVISNLYYEAIVLIDEVESRDVRLREADRTITESAKALEECRAQLRLAYQEIAASKANDPVDLDDQNAAGQLELLKAEVEQLRVFADSVRLGGSELERRAEEINRKLIGENLERLRAVRRLGRVEKRLETEEGINRSLRDRTIAVKSTAAHENATLLKQLDDAWAEEARLQGMLLECVPRASYLTLHDKYVRLLRSSAQLEAATAAEQSLSESIVPDILPRRGTAGEANQDAIEALQRQLDHTKRLLSILEDQSAFWQNESETLRRENAEMRQLLEQCESEGDTEAILVSIQTHLLRALREQADAASEGVRAKQQLTKAKADLVRVKGERADERRHLIAVARLLHTTLERSQTEILHGISVTQVETFRDKIAELMHKEEQIRENLEKTEESRRAMEDQQRRVAALREALDVVKDAEGDRASYERALHSLITRERELKDKVVSLQNETRDLRDEVHRLLSRANSMDEERKLVLEQVGMLLTLREAREATQESAKAAKTEARKNAKKEEIKKPSSSSLAIPSRELLTTESSESERTETEDDDHDERKRKPRVIIKTVLHDNTKKYEERLSQMRDTAEICIRGYKDQLDQKDRAMADMRRLLEKQLEAARSKVRVVKEFVTDPASASVVPPMTPLSPSSDKQLDQYKKDRLRLERTVADLEKANASLAEQLSARDTPRGGVREKAEASTQTTIEIREESEGVETYRGRPSSRDGGGGGGGGGGQMEGDRELLDERMARERLEEDLRNATGRLELERRTSRDTIAKLNKTNKELSRACEEVKRAALEEVKEKMSGRGGDTSRLHEDQLRQARDEIETLKRTIERHKKTIEGLRKEFQDEKRTSSSNKVQLEQWHERKRFEDTIDKLRKEVKRLTTKHESSETELARRDKRIAELERAERVRVTSLTAMECQLRALRKERGASATEAVEIAEMRTRMKLLEEQLMATRMDLNDTRTRAARLQEERRELKRVEKKEKTSEATSAKKELERKREPPAPTVQRRPEPPPPERKELAEIRTKLSTTQQQLSEARERLTRLEREHKDTVERHKLEMTRLQKAAMPISAIALLNDKLQGKEHEIRLLKSRITELEMARDRVASSRGVPL